MPQQLIQISPRWVDWLTIAALALTIAGLFVAYKQIQNSRKTLRETGELILRETHLLYESAKIFTKTDAIEEKQIEILRQRWTELLSCAEGMYQNENEWNNLIKSLEGEYSG